MKLLQLLLAVFPTAFRNSHHLAILRERQHLQSQNLDFENVDLCLDEVHSTQNITTRVIHSRKMLSPYERYLHSLIVGYFSNALSEALRDLKWTQTHLAELTDFLPPQVNRYVRGFSAIEKTSLERLVAVLPPPHNHLVLKGYLMDAIPEPFSQLVRFESGDFKPVPAGKFPAKIRPEVRDALLKLGTKSVQHLEVGDLVIKLANALEPPRQ